jgi:endoglucanase
MEIHSQKVFIKMKKSLVIVFTLLVVVPYAHSGFLKAFGVNIVDSDSTNRPIMLRGIGLGGWLVPEGYMLHTPGYGSPTDIEYKVRGLIGAANTDQFYQLYRANYVNRADIQLIAQWGFNSIRLPFHYKLLYDSAASAFRPEGFALVDSLIAWCEAANMYVILDMHCAPGGQNKDNISDSDGIEARLWTNPVNRVLTVKIWKEIARRYATRTSVAGYDLINEPVLPSGHSNTELRDLYKTITDTIRTVDPNHIVFIEGNWYATDFSLLTPPFVTNMVYSFHKYWNATDLGSIVYMTSIRTQHFVPIWMGESGENSNPWFYETVRLFEQYNIGWCWWTHKKIGTITSPLSSPISSDYQTVLNYWNGSAPRPTEAFATNALFRMAQDLAITRCVSRPDVVKALFHPDFGTIARPYKSLSIPGVIDPIDFDYGTNGVAYFDLDYKNVGGINGPAYNKGYEYRNDGVDIEKCQDAAGAPYNVGWIDNGEWIKYTVNIARTGTYRVNLRVASQSSSGQVQFLIDNVPVTSVIAVPATGAWQNWTTLTIEGLQLPAGQHVLTASFPSGSFNFSRMEFILTASDVKEIATSLPSRFDLKQNYPNPFNPSTRIEFAIAEQAYTTLVVIDALGREVATLVAQQMQPGVYETNFDADGLSSGLYFYRLQAGNTTATKKLLLMK